MVCSILRGSCSALIEIAAYDSSGPKLSGKGKDWSSWPEGYTVEMAEFWLTDDRSCRACAECKEVSENDNEVTWSFRLQGHDEWSAPPRAYSESDLYFEIDWAANRRSRPSLDGYKHGSEPWKKGIAARPSADSKNMRLVREPGHTILFSLCEVHLLASAVHWPFDRERDQKTTWQSLVHP